MLDLDNVNMSHVDSQYNNILTSEINEQSSLLKQTDYSFREVYFSVNSSVFRQHSD